MSDAPPSPSAASAPDARGAEPPVDNNRRQEVKVGVFVFGLTIAMGLLIIFIGGSSDMLADRYRLKGAWKDVSGLKEGAVVRLAGWDVGEVSAVTFSEDLGVREVYVELKILGEFQPRIRKDSHARIDTVGVIGDKYVAITVGDPKEPVLENGDWIVTEEALNVLEYSAKVSEVLASTSNIAHKVDLMLGDDQEAAKASLARSFQHLERLLAATETGNGLVHTLVYDEDLTRKVKGTLGNLEVMSADLRATTTEVRTGDGIAHQLVFGDEGKKLAADLSQVAAAMSTLATDIKREDSMVHSLLYDPSKKQMVDDLAQTAAALKVTSEAIAKGDGTVGLLTRDPALYEDLRALVGGAQRNKLLRAYIRKTVAEGEATNANPWEPVKE
jgi:phospholipid/cholesterol/gamma-HCH transport system substrate-binding protein